MASPAQALADRAGVHVAFVNRLVDLGILRPVDGAFSTGDRMRIRLMLATERAGVPLEAVGRAIAEGRFSLVFLDMPHYRWSEVTDVTFAQAAAEHGIDLEYLLTLEEAQGTERPSSDDRVRQDILELVPLLHLSLNAGIDATIFPRLGRTYAESMRRIAEAEGHVYHHYIEEPMLRAGMDHRQTTELANAFGAEITAMQEGMLVNMYRRQQELVWTADVIDHMEQALDEMGLVEKLDRPPSMVFLDLSGFTRLTAEQGDEAAADLVGRLGALAQTASKIHGGRPVKWLGDGVMFWFPDAASGVSAALQLVEEVPAAGLPPAHIGVAAGAVIAQDGDYYGRTVNLAARLAGHAGPGQVLVDPEVARLTPDFFDFTELESAELKGFPNPMTIYLATPEVQK